MSLRTAGRSNEKVFAFKHGVAGIPNSVKHNSVGNVRFAIAGELKAIYKYAITDNPRYGENVEVYLYVVGQDDQSVGKYGSPAMHTQVIMPAIHERKYNMRAMLAEEQAADFAPELGIDVAPKAIKCLAKFSAFIKVHQ